MYIKDVGSPIWGALNCSHFPNNCDDNIVPYEPGHETNPLRAKDGGDWWYTVATHFDNLDGRVDGFLADSGISPNDDRYCWDAQYGTLQHSGWCTNETNKSTWVVPFDGERPTKSPGQYLEKRVRPFYIDQDDGFRGGYVWNAFTRYIDQEVKAVMFWLVSDEYHTPIVQKFGMSRPSIDKNQEWGAGGKSLYWAAPGLDPYTEVCPWNPFYRYDYVNIDRAQYDGTSGVSSNDQAAGYVACNYRPGYSGWKVWYPSTFDFLIFQGTGLPRREFREDDDGDGIPNHQENPPQPDTKFWWLIPDGDYGIGVDGLHRGREDALLMAGLEQQLALKWAKNFGFSGYTVKNWFVRALHNMPDEDDGQLGDDNLTFDICAGQEYGAVDWDSGGYRTPQGEVLYHVITSANYEWWPERSDWIPEPNAPGCYNRERYQQRPDQSHDRDGNGNNVDFADFPSGW